MIYWRKERPAVSHRGKHVINKLPDVEKIGMPFANKSIWAMPRFL